MNTGNPAGSPGGNFNAVTLPQAQGPYTLQYDSDWYAPGGPANGAPNPEWAILTTAGGGGNKQAIAIVPGPSTTLPVLGTPVVGSGAVTSIPIVSGGSGLQAGIITISGGGGTGAAAVATINSSGVLSAIAILNGGNSYSAPTATFTPIAQVAGVVTVAWNVSYSTPNAGGNIALSLALVSSGDQVGSSGMSPQHVRNPWVFAPNNTIDRSNPLATDDVVVRNLSNNGKGPGVIRAMEAIGGPVNANIVDVADLMLPTWYSWDPYLNINGNVPTGPPNSPGTNGTTTAGSINSRERHRRHVDSGRRPTRARAGVQRRRRRWRRHDDRVHRGQ